jgi:hypothetical protein
MNAKASSDPWTAGASDAAGATEEPRIAGALLHARGDRTGGRANGGKLDFWRENPGPIRVGETPLDGDRDRTRSRL